MFWDEGKQIDFFEKTKEKLQDLKWKGGISAAVKPALPLPFQGNWFDDLHEDLQGKLCIIIIAIIIIANIFYAVLLPPGDPPLGYEHSSVDELIRGIRNRVNLIY